MKDAKTEALKKKLGNVVCAKCGSKKHKTKDHGADREEKIKDDEKEVRHDKEEDEEENGDEK